MAEKSILFCGQMARAIAEGRKTQTRRLVRMVHRRECAWQRREGDEVPYEWMDGDHDFARYDYRQPCRCIVASAPYEAGDRLVLLTAWAVPIEFDHLKPRDLPTVFSVSALVWSYFSTPKKPEGFGKLRPARFTPKFLYSQFPRGEATEVRVQRVQEISEEDAIAEGCPGCRPHLDNCHALTWYRALWDSLNQKRGYPWESNPWVFAYTFRRIY